MVTKICFRWSPYTGRITTRSKNNPSTPASAMAATTASAIAERFAATLEACMEPVITPSTEAAA